MPVQNEEKIIICLDFDYSLCLNHLHSECATIISETINDEDKNELKENKTKYLWNKLKEKGLLVSAGDAAGWKKLLKGCIDQGCHVAIITWSNYPEIIQKFLREIIGLQHDIHIESGFTGQNKLDHMKRALIKFDQFDESSQTPFESVIVLDDTYDDFNLIEQKGGTTIKLIPGEIENLEIATKELNEKVPIVQANLTRKYKIKTDEEKINWLSNKLDLATFIWDDMFAKRKIEEETNSVVNDVKKEMDSGKNPFRDYVEMFENYIQKQIKFKKTLLNDQSLDLILNSHQEKYHDIRMVALMLKEIYKKYPEHKNEYISNLVDKVENISDLYKYKNQNLIDENSLKDMPHQGNI